MVPPLYLTYPDSLFGVRKSESQKVKGEVGRRVGVEELLRLGPFSLSDQHQVTKSWNPRVVLVNPRNFL